MKFRKKTALTFAVFGLGVLFTQAQTGVGTLNPDNSAQLDVTSGTRGMLMPRVALTETKLQAPIVGTPVKSLLVYNTAAINDVVPGFYYWDGKWVRMSTGNTGQVLGYKQINANYEVRSEDYTIVATGLTNDITVTLPDPTGANTGRVLVINQANGTNTTGDEVTVKFNVAVVYSDKVSKAELYSPIYSSSGGSLKITLQSDGKNWYVISSL